MTNAAPADAPQPTRLDRRKARTRQALIDAAVELIATGRGDRASIQEITDAADIGFGSFYNHFESKEAIAEAVLVDTVLAQGAEIDALTSQLEDPAEIISAAHRTFVRRAGTDPDWGWLLVRLNVSHNAVVAALEPYARRDFRAAVKADRIRVPNEEIALLAAAGALLAVMHAVLEGQAPKQADVLHAEGVLRMFGLAPDDAAKVARRPLPAI
jgi:AcrR family transcriptional regulator